MKTIRVGSGAGYAGDRLEPALELIEKGNLDYISFECLAERTIAIGQQAKLKDPTKGYNGLLEHRMEKALPLCWKHKVKLITNMGSANPEAAAAKCVEIAKKHGLTGMKIACVTGDDLLPMIDKYQDSIVWETGEPLSQLPGEIVSANAYLGMDAIIEALEKGADVVITGGQLGGYGFRDDVLLLPLLAAVAVGAVNHNAVVDAGFLLNDPGVGYVLGGVIRAGGGAAQDDVAAVVAAGGHDSAHTLLGNGKEAVRVCGRDNTVHRYLYTACGAVFEAYGHG